MDNKFEAFERCFKMSINATQSESLECLRVKKDRHKQLEFKIAIEMVTKFEMLVQLKSDLEILDDLFKSHDSKVKAKKCCEVVNKVITIVIKRINDLWNTMFLLFTINVELEEFLDPIHTNRMSSGVKFSSNNVRYKNIISKVGILSTQEGTIFDFASSDFIKILQTTAFVDKTLMIKELFQNKEFKKTVITAPRKYGKSTNLTMLKYFLEIQVDSLGKPLTKANADKPITDTSHFEVFKELKIGKVTDIMHDHFGKYPVMYVNFKVEMYIKTYACVIETCKKVIHKAFQSHNYLQKSSKLDIREKKLCKLWCGDASYKTITNINDICIGFESLSKCLTKHYNKPCFVLIDEPEFLTLVSIAHTLFEDYKRISFFISQCLLFLTNEEFVVRAFVTGKSGYAIGRIVSSCIKIQPFSEFHEFTDYYGLTINELEYLFEKPEFDAVTVTINEVKAYYGSYNKIDQLSKKKKEIYCIWSILNVLKCKRLDNFWRDFGSIFCNFSNPTIKDAMQVLLINEPNMVMVHDTTKPKTYIDTPPSIIAASGNPTENSLDFFFNLLLEIGYLTYDSAVVQVLDLYNSKNTCMYVKIPNEEVREDIKKKISLLS
ncbi:uncharacterized protein LOC132937151 [Metopolophium dirhodum]|uniref:uncharacterized protein LOC132937151 n=1 Tax=Metopolophium dirhodum TaxID=44670 RepID=UPI002990292A|nr:uncharacterized protein LOC132937151 [Metopolophium dirhodum]